jgi:hypothetical protein
MKRVVHTTLAFLALTLAVGAKDKPVFSLTAHVLSAGVARTHSVYRHGAGSNSTGVSRQQLTEIQIGNLIYSSESQCKLVDVGKEYPAALDDKHKILQLDMGYENKICRYRVSAVREDKQ